MEKKSSKTYNGILGIIAAFTSLIVLFFYDSDILISFKNTSLSALHGFLVCSALILYSSNAKYLPAADLTLLSLTEVLGGIFGYGFHFRN